MSEKKRDVVTIDNFPSGSRDGLCQSLSELHHGRVTWISQTSTRVLTIAGQSVRSRRYLYRTRLNYLQLVGPGRGEALLQEPD
ncbi:hypothetical protein RRG08_047814 [Elysia crispata]|uniref:Uncharacterized protein n=1 Tax=Elysia crispata TaxID=231223 RepID=A0AAE0Y2Z4_9GAST|nr:hypothetical protein RRG08_047814 [Elysia crispata]